MAEETSTDPVGEKGVTGNAEEDWQIFDILCRGNKMDENEVDITTALKSELAALQYKRDRLTAELEDMRCQFRSRDQRCLELQVEAEQLREQSARQNAIISSLKKRIHDLEDRERNLYSAQSRSEIAYQTALRDNKYHEEKIKDLEQKLRSTEMDLTSQEQKKESARLQMQDFIRRLCVALGSDISDSAHMSPEALVHKASELVQDTSRLRSRTTNINDTLATVELELRTCRENLERAISDKECLQRQAASQALEIDRLKQEKESLEMLHRSNERELVELREKLSYSNKSLGSASGNLAQQEATVCQLREELKTRDERIQRIQNENRHFLESLAILLSTPSRFVESLEVTIKDRIRDLTTEIKEKTAQLESTKENLNTEQQQFSRQISLYDQATARIRSLEDEKAHLESRLNKAENDITSCEMAKDGFRRDKQTFLNFLERLARALNMEEMANDIGVDLHTESLLLRAEQLSRLESDKLVDKTALVYQLQRRVRNLREQVQRKDLHLDLLRRKLNLQEDNMKNKCILQSERDEANARIKKLIKQVDHLQVQLSEAKSHIRDLNSQLAEAADYKITALERGRKIEDLQKRLIESETLRTKYNRKLTQLKDQVRTTGETIDQERNISEHSMQLLRDELSRVKDTLSEIQRREAQLQSFKSSIAKILGVALPMPDYELIGRLQKLVDAHHDFTLVSRRYDDPVLRLATRSPTGGSRVSRTPDRSRYDDSGYTDGVDIDDIDDDLFKRPSRPI
ncbi:coiled-coil domain-containing protein 170 [Harmonia axyridis]|uniref:coiled-coil domain-containing protein 170 n=1 Tax=Harmonia axyridis TaxID=115357 RepID=UPI001E2764B2|nr:coiled-coil domain-containing protein 170 [Harmonia axyridis]